MVGGIPVSKIDIINNLRFDLPMTSNNSAPSADRISYKLLKLIGRTKLLQQILGVLAMQISYGGTRSSLVPVWIGGWLRPDSSDDTKRGQGPLTCEGRGREIKIWSYVDDYNCTAQKKGGGRGRTLEPITAARTTRGALAEELSLRSWERDFDKEEEIDFVQEPNGSESQSQGALNGISTPPGGFISVPTAVERLRKLQYRAVRKITGGYHGARQELLEACSVQVKLWDMKVRAAARVFERVIQSSLIQKVEEARRATGGRSWIDHSTALTTIPPSRRF